MRVGRAFLQTFASQAVQSIASIATAILIARGLGPEGQGRYALLVAAVGLLSTIGGAGQFEGHVLTSAGHSTRGRLLLLRSAAQAFLVLGGMVVTRPLWRGPLGLGQGDRIQVLFLTVLVLEVLALLCRGLNLGQHHITAYNVTTLLQRVGFLLVIGISAYALRLNLALVLTAWAGAALANVVVAATWIWRRSDRLHLSWKMILSGWGASLLRGFRALVTICLSLLLIRIDVYMLGPMLGVGAVGQISVASTFTEYLWYVPSILGSVLFAAVASESGPQSVQKVCRAVRTSVIVIGIAVLGLAMVGRQVMFFVYGAAYAEAGVVMVILLPGMFAVALHLVLDSYFAGKGFPPISYVSVAGAIVVKVLGNLMLVPRAGLSGAAVSTSVAYLALLASKVVAFSKATHASPRLILVPTISDVTNGVRDLGRWTKGGLRG